MDKWDRDNLNFLLNVDEDTFEEFMAQSSDDDIQYAIELIQTHKAELLTRQIELEDALIEAEGLDLSDAQDVLSRFRL
jgi:hypothetical protein